MEQTRKQGRAKGTPKTGGRVKGTPNHLTSDVKAAILHAFDKVGGAAYLAEIAVTEPRAFLALLGRVVPAQVAVTGADGGAMQWSVTVNHVSSPSQG